MAQKYGGAGSYGTTVPSSASDSLGGSLGPWPWLNGHSYDVTYLGKSLNDVNRNLEVPNHVSVDVKITKSWATIKNQ